MESLRTIRLVLLAAFILSTGAAVASDIWIVTSDLPRAGSLELYFCIAANLAVGLFGGMGIVAYRRGDELTRLLARLYCYGVLAFSLVGLKLFAYAVTLYRGWSGVYLYAG